MRFERRDVWISSDGQEFKDQDSRDRYESQWLNGMNDKTFTNVLYSQLKAVAKAHTNSHEEPACPLCYMTASCWEDIQHREPCLFGEWKRRLNYA